MWTIVVSKHYTSATFLYTANSLTLAVKCENTSAFIFAYSERPLPTNKRAPISQQRVAVRSSTLRDSVAAQPLSLCSRPLLFFSQHARQSNRQSSINGRHQLTRKQSSSTRKRFTRLDGQKSENIPFSVRQRRPRPRRPPPPRHEQPRRWWSTTTRLAPLALNTRRRTAGRVYERNCGLGVSYDTNETRHSGCEGRSRSQAGMAQVFGRRHAPATASADRDQ